MMMIHNVCQVVNTYKEIISRFLLFSLTRERHISVEKCLLSEKIYKISRFDVITSTKRLCFHFVCLLVSRITQKLQDRLPHNLVEGCDMGEGSIHRIWVRIRKMGGSGFLFYFFLQRFFLSVLQ